MNLDNQKIKLLHYQKGKNVVYKTLANTVCPLIDAVISMYPIFSLNETIAMIDYEYRWLNHNMNWSLDGKPLTPTSLKLLYNRSELSYENDLLARFSDWRLMPSRLKNQGVSLDGFYDLRSLVVSHSDIYWRHRDEDSTPSTPTLPLLKSIG